MHLRKFKVVREVLGLSDGPVCCSTGWSELGFRNPISTSILPHIPLNLNFPHTDRSSCSKPGWWTGCKHANRKGSDTLSATGRPHGFRAEWREIKNRRIYSADEGSVVALSGANEPPLNMRQIGEAC